MYTSTKVTVCNNQYDKLKNAIAHQEPISIKLNLGHSGGGSGGGGSSGGGGEHTLLLTRGQILKIDRSRLIGKRKVTIPLSKRQVKANVQHQGGFGKKKKKKIAFYWLILRKMSNVVKENTFIPEDGRSMRGDMTRKDFHPFQHIQPIFASDTSATTTTQMTCTRLQPIIHSHLLMTAAMTKKTTSTHPRRSMKLGHSTTTASKIYLNRTTTIYCNNNHTSHRNAI